MNRVTISLPDALAATVDKRASDAGFQSKEDYLLALIRSDCNQADLESELENRIEGPFASLEADWKQLVREKSRSRG